MTLTSAPKAHLVANDLVHGDLKDDQYFVGPAPAREVFLGDFGTAWRLLGVDGVPLRLANREDQLERRAGVGGYKVRRARQAGPEVGPTPKSQLRTSLLWLFSCWNA